jgi:hypothetical protein
LRTDADHLLPQVKGMPIVAVSGLMGEGIDRLMSAIEEAYAVWNRRVPTASLNRWFEQAVDANPPPAVSGRRLKLNYITQAKARPPSFILFCSRADAVPQSYLRYLVNSLREFFELPGTPVRIALREKANPFAHKRKRPSRSIFLFEHDLFGKPVSTFPDHALITVHLPIGPVFEIADRELPEEWIGIDELFTRCPAGRVGACHE